MVFQPASLLLLLFPPLPIADFVLLLTFQNVALPFKTLYILKSFSIQCEGGGWEAVKVENQEHPSATSLHVFGLLATKKK